MDNLSDKLKKSFQCEECKECFTTKQNLCRHISRKHKEMVWESVVESPLTTVNELIETDPLISIVLDDKGVVSNSQPESTPQKDFLMHLRNEYKKYEYLYEKIDTQERWIKNNRDIDLIRYYQKHNRFVKCILTDIKDLYAKPKD
jgi:hypothetical protein